MNKQPAEPQLSRDSGQSLHKGRKTPRWAAALLVVAAATATVGLATPQRALACVVDPSTGQCAPPPGAVYPGNVTLSRYVRTTNLYTMGCNQGRKSDAQGQPRQIVILSFGDPGWDGSNTLGAYPGGRFVSDAAIEANVKQYMQGFWDCTVAGSGSHLTVAPGVTNASGGINSSHDNALGTAWGSMVRDLNAWISAYGRTRQLEAYGALDAEPGWGPASHALAWAAGFSGSGQRYFDFGSADGCPPAGSACANGWTQANEYQIAWGNSAAYAVPEIYNDTMARQWAAISAWGAAHTSGGPIRWSAAMSQYQACVDVKDPCPGTKNDPMTAWQQLATESGTPPTYATQISYQTT